MHSFRLPHLVKHFPISSSPFKHHAVSYELYSKWQQASTGPAIFKSSTSNKAPAAQQISKHEIISSDLSSIIGGNKTLYQHPGISSNGNFNVIEFDKKGNARPIELERNILYNKYGLQGRDVRVLVSSLNYPTILSRKASILIDVRDIHAVITKENLYLVQGENLVDTISFLQSDLKFQNRLSSSTNHGMIWEPSNLPFELQCLESILNKVCTDVDEECAMYAKQVNQATSDPELSFKEEKLYELLQLKNKLHHFGTFVAEFHESINSLLQSDEDMAMMYLTEKEINGEQRRLDQHTEVEMLLETYFTRLEDVMSHIKEINSIIISTQEFVNICLDTTRNRMMEMELKISMITLAVTMGALVAGLFGMNLISGWENSSTAFHITAAMVVTLVLIIVRITFRISKAKGVFNSGRHIGDVTKRLKSKEFSNNQLF